MGMFDTLSINTDLLPVSEEEKEWLSKEEFQTKSLDSALLQYRITDDGYLEYLQDSGGFSNREITDDEHWIRISTVHGYVSFYASVSENKQWYEFVAKFTDGKLVEIIRNQGQTYYENRSE